MADIVGTNDPETLTGTPDNDTITGLGGNDTLNGLGGADAMSGGLGDDAYIVDNAGDQTIELAGEGTDTVYSYVNYVLAGGTSIEVLSTANQAGTEAINLTGNEIAQILYGNAGTNTLNGGGGADVMWGFGGDDVYFVDNAGDQVRESAGQGTDTVYVSVNYTLANNMAVEILSAIDLLATTPLSLGGNNLVNTINGNAGDNLINGGVGADTLIGFGGNDVYLIDNAGDVVVEGANGGFDTGYIYTSYVLAAGLQLEVVSAYNWYGNEAFNFTGNELDNRLYGNGGVNQFVGGAGHDMIIGFGGGDTMTGGSGDDHYYTFAVNDVIVETAGGGYDSVFSYTTFTLAADDDIEILSTYSFGGTEAIDLTGNALAQLVYGNAGVNVLNGGLGADFLNGFGGADTFAFTTALGATNIDTIGDFVAGTDKIRLAGAAAEPFAALASGTLRSGTLVIGTAAADADDYLIYNSTTGALLYDADGNGAGAAVQFATLSTGLSLSVADFTIAGAANNATVVTSGATASVAENMAASTIVYQASATDADGDRITYTLTGADASLLTIDQNGAVRLIVPADFETKNSYSFNVVASDSASSTPKAVTLTITDATEAATPIINEVNTPNDSTAAAQAIDRGTFLVANNPNLVNDDLPSATINGNVTVPGDKDFFSITLQAGEQLILDVDGTNGLDSFLTLYNSLGQPIGDNDDLIGPDPGSNPPFGHNTDSQILLRAATSGTYYFSIESFSDENGPTSSGAYQIHVSIGPPATAAQLIDEDINGLVSGAAWDDTDLSFGFPTLASQYPASFEETNPASRFSPFTGTQQTATIQLLQLVANVTPLTFTQNTATPGQADLRYAMSTEAEVAYAYYPTNGGPSSLGGSAWFNNDDFDDPQRGNYAWMGILHETGHALGLKHGHEFPLAISANRDSTEYSIMTYRSFPGDDTNGYNNETWGFPQTLMMYDIAALQRIYDGANYTYNATNTVYSWGPGNGQTMINGASMGAVGANRIFLTIWDGGGTDTYDLSAYASATTIDLRPGEWSTTSSAQLAGLGMSHFARGNIANALMFEGNTASLIENAIGGGGADTIYANQAANALTGNGGGDTFLWTAGTDAGTGASADTILDFVRGADKIHLTGVDANSTTAATNEDFSFIGTAAFNNVAGQLRYQVEGGNLRVQADLNGNGVADMEIVVNNNTIFAASDFFL